MAIRIAQLAGQGLFDCLTSALDALEIWRAVGSNLTSGRSGDYRDLKGEYMAKAGFWPVVARIEQWDLVKEYELSDLAFL